MIKMFIRVILVLIFAANCLPALSQVKCAFDVKGKVIDQESQEPVEGAYIWIKELEKGAVTNHNGNFHFRDICEGHYELNVEILGYASKNIQLNVHENVNMTIRLESKDYLIDGVEIVGHKDAVNTLNSITHLGKDLLDENRGGNLGETLKALPGVTTFTTGANISKPVIHGMHSNRIMILNNEVRQEGQQWGGEHAPEVDPFMAEDISVIKGAETVRFGSEAMGGVILVTPPKLPVAAGTSGTATLVGGSNGWNGAAAFSFEGGLKDLEGFGYRIQASSRIGGNIKSPAYYQDNTGMKELNFSGAVGYNSKKLGMELFYSRFATTIGILSDSHTGNSSDLEELIANGRPFSNPDFTYHIENPRQEVTHQLLKAKGHYHLNNDGVINLTYAFQQNNRQEFDIRRGELNDRAALDLELFTNTLDINYEHPSSKNWNGSIGISALQQANNNIPGTGVTPLIPNYDMVNLGAFMIEKYTKGPLELEGGARFDYRYVDAARYNQGELDEQDFTFQNFTAFLGAGYSLNKNWLLTTNLGSAWRPPNINEQFSQGLHHGAAAVEIGDPNLVSEQALKWVNTVNYSSEKLNAELTGYYHKINNYIYLNPTGEEYVSLRGTFNVFEYLQTDAGFWGIDLTTDYTILPSLEWFIKGSLIRAKNLTDQNYLPFIPTDRLETGLVYQADKIGKLELSHLSVAKQRREPDVDLAPAPPGYNLWTARISRDLLVKEKSSLKGSLGITNIFNTEYKDYMNRFRYFTHEMGRNFTLRLKYEF
ncbi:TonB-dependent receptor [Echinicola vietnamensis]|uniref:Outer membrane receptor protein n=1 Tax=Echinicola vietnamensis (strain DSM 17526 / LMG 23754 / KMM 6221) TaxID=926556 RepID=L0G2N5_ECHVK|nr:TonB-dependent receptor [Echinicola vietnamensis]AGA79261.1 outer membrane receptor protein [Echinicola vietnamensis DSM 17526]